MKRLLLAALLVLPSSAVGQAKFFGVAAGATLSDYTDYWGFDTHDRWGFTAGFIAGIRTANWMAISLEPSYTQMGGGDLRADYVEVPLTFGGVARSGDGKMRYGGYTGITGAFKVTCSEPSAFDFCDRVNGSAWFIPLGLRFLRATKPGTFVGIDIKYNLPLGSSVDNAEANQRAWAFRLVFIKGNTPTGY